MNNRRDAAEIIQAGTCFFCGLGSKKGSTLGKSFNWLILAYKIRITCFVDIDNIRFPHIGFSLISRNPGHLAGQIGYKFQILRNGLQIIAQRIGFSQIRHNQLRGSESGKHRSVKLMRGSPGHFKHALKSFADPMFFLPQLYYTREMNEKLSLGVGFYTPFGLSVEWEDGNDFSGRGAGPA